MKWLNIYGLIIITIIMIPNIIFLLKEKNFESKYNNKTVEIIEQIGRVGSIFLMVLNIPLLEFGYWFDNGKTVYMFFTGTLALVYCFIWFLYLKKQTMAKAMLLAIIPIIIFLISGIILAQVLLIVTSILFGIGHILITYNNNL